MPDLMTGRRGRVMGVGNGRTIACGTAAEAAELTFFRQGEASGKRAAPLAAKAGSAIFVDVDVTDAESRDAGLADHWDRLDVMDHAIAFSDTPEVPGRFINTNRANVWDANDISRPSPTDVTRCARPGMSVGGAVLTRSWQGSNQVTPFCTVMGMAKPGLESALRYLSNDPGPEGIRVNAVPPRPMKTLAGAALGGARPTSRTAEANASLRAGATSKAMGGTAAHLASDCGTACTTGEIIPVHGDDRVLGMALPKNL